MSKQGSMYLADAVILDNVVHVLDNRRKLQDMGPDDYNECCHRMAEKVSEGLRKFYRCTDCKKVLSELLSC